MASPKFVTRKIMLLGEIGVGKTSIAKRLSFDTFEESYKATIGSDIYLYEVDPPPDGVPFQFIVWDTDGSFGEAILKHVYLRQAHAAMIVADVTRPATLDTMANLADAFTDKLPGRFVSFVLNKADLLPHGQDPPLPRRITDSGIPISRTSAKTGENVRQSFHEAATTILRREVP